MDGAAVSGAAIAKRLASCNKSARNRAIRHLTAWLSEQPPAAVSDADLIKIWKGLFYCVWHADKLPAQLDLINRLAALLPSLPAPLAAGYFDAFLSTIRREWSGIDFLRLDKFYLLIRRFLRHLFLLLHNCSWDPDLSSRLIAILSEKSLLAADKHPAQGVNNHIAEIFFDELADFLPVSPQTLDVLLKPFHLVLEQSLDKVLVSKIKTNVFDRLLQNGAKLLDLERAGDLGGEVEKLGKIVLAMGLSNKFFISASAPETLQGNRKVLFGLHAGFLKLEKDLEKSGAHVTIELPDNGNPMNAPGSAASESNGQVEMDPGCGDGGSEDQLPKKKRKKSKKALDGVEKKTKTKKKKKKKLDSVKESEVAVPSSEADIVANGANEVAMDVHNLITFDEPVMSNLQKQFEKVAAEAGMASDSTRSSDLSATPVITTALKKRKRAKSVDRQVTVSPGSVNGGSMAGKSGEKSVKKVRFLMKNNLVWKPHSPLPPQSLRLPPSATPRGSALKKGIPPGPIKETPPMAKKVKVKSSSTKKVLKGSKGVSPTIKRLRKLQSLSV